MLKDALQSREIYGEVMDATVKSDYRAKEILVIAPLKCNEHFKRAEGKQRKCCV